jgi:hypothetical protein
VANFLISLDARKTFLLKALPSSRSGDDCCVIFESYGFIQCTHSYENDENNDSSE